MKSSIKELQGIGQWVEQKSELKLSGGFLPAGMQDVWSFEIVLRAYVNSF